MLEDPPLLLPGRPSSRPNKSSGPPTENASNLTRISSIPSSNPPNRPLPEVPQTSRRGTKGLADKTRTTLTSYLTSLSLQRQDLEAQLGTLEGILETYDCPGVSPPSRRSLARGPFNERLAGLLSSSTDSANEVKPSAHLEPFAESTGGMSFESENMFKTHPLKPQTPSNAVEHLPPESPGFKKTVEILKDSYQSAALKLAEVELEIELVYLRGDMESARERREWREASVYKPKTR